jgi:DNA replication and repair protein RecF
MRIRHLHLSDYRNFPRLDLALPAGPAIILGANAQGKSNLLEAVHLLATMRSPRTGSDAELIRWQTDPLAGPPVGRLVAEVDAQDGPLRLEMAVVGRSSQAVSPGGEQGPGGHATKSVRVNGLARRLSDAVGQLAAVLFTAHDMEMVVGPPSLRRRFLDIAISQVDGAYLRALQRYAKVLLQRNHLLKRLQDGSARREELAFWDEQLVLEASEIVGARALAVANLAPLAAAAHANLSDGREEMSLVYQPHLGGTIDGDQAASLARQELATTFAQELGRWCEREVRAGATILGPHRDDLLIRLDGVSAAAFASRAQQRTIALALRLAEARLLRQRRGDSPVLLLDDVLSELDTRRRAAVLAAVADYEQVIITATDLDRFSPNFLARAALFRVAEGSVEAMPSPDAERGEVLPRKDGAASL